MDQTLKQEPLFKGEGGEIGDTGGFSISLFPISIKKEDSTCHSDNTVARPSINPTQENLGLARSEGVTSSHKLQAPEREDDEPEESLSDEGIGRSPATYENVIQSQSEEEAGTSSVSEPDTRKGLLLDTLDKPIFFCDVCGMAFTEENHLARHMQKHTFICHFCSKQFSSDFELLQHEDVHKKGQEHCCKECDIIFESKAALEEHYGEHMYACSLCPKTFTNNTALLNHETGHQDPKLNCNDCGKTFNRLSNLKVHKQKHCRGENQFSRNLNEGPRGSISHRSVEETPVQTDGEDNETGNSAEDDDCWEQDDMAFPVKNAVAPKLGSDMYFHCLDCPKAFSNSEDFAKHKLNHQGNYGSMTNSTTTRSKAHEGLETSTYGNGFECKDCRTTYPSLAALQNHLLKHIYPCDLCDRTFTNLRQFKRHVNSHNPIYPCPHCQRQFKKRYYLKVHVAKVHGPIEKDGAGKRGTGSTETLLKDTKEPPSPVQPSSCESLLKTQIGMKHSLRLKCRICGKSYARKCDLTRHMNRGKHTQPRLQTSSGLKVETPSHQQQSISNGHAKSPSLSATFKGIIRPKTISKQSKMIMHRNSGKHGNDGSVQDSKMREPPTTEFRCKFCSKIFAEKRYLTDHTKRKHQEINHETKVEMLEKSKSLVFQCRRCPKRFHRKSDLTMHIKRGKHQATSQKGKGVVKDSETGGLPKISSRKQTLNSPSSNSDLRCKICSKKFSSQYHLSVHRTLEKHDSISVIQCSICSTIFKQKRYLTDHMKRKHPGLGINITKAKGPKNLDGSEIQSKRKSNISIHIGHGKHENVHQQGKNAMVGSELGGLPKDFKCSECPKAYGTLGHLQRHRKKNHQDSRMTEMLKKSQGTKFHGRKCPKTFRRKSDLTIHMKQGKHQATSQNGKGAIKESETGRLQDYKCRICGKIFARKCDLTGHMYRGKHNRPRLQTSSGLKVETPSHQQQSSSNGHAKSPSLSATVKGNVRSKTISKRSKLIMHRNSGKRGNYGSVQDSKMREPPTSEFQCKFCSKIFAKKRYLTDHTKRKHQEMNNVTKVEVLEKSKSLVFQCRRCPKRFHRKSDLTMHMKRGKHQATSQKGKGVSSSSNLRCKICSKTFSSQYRLSVHMALGKHDNSSVTQCSICSTIFKQKRYLTDHMRRKHPGLRINITKAKGPKNSDGSEIQSKRKSNISLHIRHGKHENVHQQGKDAMVGSDFKCSECPKAYGTKRHLQRHFKKNHPKGRMAEKLKKSQGTKFHCRKKVFKKKGEHMNQNQNHQVKDEPMDVPVISSEPTFVCTKCPKEFARKCDLNVHLDRCKHLRTKEVKIESGSSNLSELLTHKCTICTKSYSNRSSLLRHIKGKHPGHQCQMCPKSFACKRYLTAHIKCRHPELLSRKSNGKGSSVGCPKCFKSFSRKYTLTQHIKKCHYRRVYQSKSVSKEIPAVGSSCRSYQCPQCPKAFLTAFGLTMHIKLGEHISVKNRSRDIFENTKVRGPKDSFYQCGKCPRVFSRQGDLSLHMRLGKHLTEESAHKYFQCPKCPRSFSRKNYLLQHMKKGEHINQSQIIKDTTIKEGSSGSKRFTCSTCTRSYTRKSQLQKHINSKHSQSESQEAVVFSQQTRAVVSEKSNGLLPDGKEVGTAASSLEGGSSSKMEQQETVVISQHTRTVVSEKSKGLLPDGKEVGTAAPSSEIGSSSKMEQEEAVVFSQQARTVSEKSNGFLPDGKEVGTAASSLEKGGSLKMAWKCPECEKIFASRPELNRHQDTHVFMCNYCNRFFTTQKSLEEHACAQRKRVSSPYPVASEVPKLKNPEVVYKCELCMKSFSSSKDLETHQEQHTLNEFKDDATTSSASVIPDRFLTCRFCDMVFTSLELVHNHERSHLSSM